MARKRMIDPEFFLDEELAELSFEARLFYIGTWGICDDTYSTFPNRPKWLKAQIFPYDLVDIEKLLEELEQKKKIILFTFENEEFWFCKNFKKHQRIDRPSKPHYPEYSNKKKRVLDEDSANTRPEVNISKDKLKEIKLSKVNNSIEVVAEAPNEVNKLIGLFEPVNPSYKRLYPRVGQRLALERMINEHGYSQVEKAILSLPYVVGKQFAPTITTPYELEQKMGSLMAYLKKNQVTDEKFSVTKV